MIVLKRLEGQGEFLAKGNEFPASYKVVVSRSADRIGADGVAHGIELPDIMAIQECGDVKLRMEDGTEVDVAFLGGVLDGPQRFVINTRLPGF
ncbi:MULTISPECIES: hypothetical protein [Agrobacterium]|uniref:hypothetical protein n=1 Tax=Agrobacterium tumefaciens TaxID=358 RepID=UPI00122FBC85|nr:hypothetical protein DXM29_04585 [Agrobacterium tumefaciens]NSY05772.1 hypothetical protein [Agrobacterium tumefaciens]NSZ05618.1 hypothetical protein [Agrobacterium tumefaciens]